MLSDDGATIVKQIIFELEKGLRTLPTEISLKHLEIITRIRPQNIGMSFTPYIDKPLAAKGILARKCGRPGRLQLCKIDITG